MEVECAFSPCPNDTYAFYAWVHGKIESDIKIKPVLLDIAALNEEAEKGSFPITKLSVYTLGRVKGEYAMLQVGAALGMGVGPKLVARERFDSMRDKVVAVPGKYTTAHGLVELLVEKPKEMRFMPYDKVVEAISSGRCDAGVIIHETRFTYVEYGLKELCDLGELFYKKYALPVPLGAIAVKKSLGDDFRDAAERALYQSLVYAKNHPDEVWEYVLQHSQEKDPEVIKKHINLYVNDETYQMSDTGKKAIETLLIAF